MLHRPAGAGFRIVREDGVWVLEGRAAERAVNLDDLSSLEALDYVGARLARAGITEALVAAGAETGDDVQIGDLLFEFRPDDEFEDDEEEAAVRRALAAGRPVVVKVGSSSLAPGGGGLDPDAVGRIVDQIADLWEAGHPTALVSSGAVAAGIPVLGTPTDRPAGIPGGGGGWAEPAHGAVYGAIRRAGPHRRPGACSPRTCSPTGLNTSMPARRSLACWRSGWCPIVNENDSVGVEELRFGDNDRLAAVVSHLAGAGMLILLTDTPGLYSGDPRLDAEAELITAVRHTDEALDEVVQGAPGPLGSGGVATKVAAARMAAWSGVPTVIAAAGEPDVVARAVAGDEIGTWIDPHRTALPARKLWIAFGQPAEGRLTIDRRRRRRRLSMAGSPCWRSVSPTSLAPSARGQPSKCSHPTVSCSPRASSSIRPLTSPKLQGNPAARRVEWPSTATTWLSSQAAEPRSTTGWAVGGWLSAS